jgi:anti-anti-sigma factor
MRHVSDDFSVSRVGPAAWAVSGELDLASARAFEQALTSADEPGDLVLDCSGLLFMDSQGVRSLLVAAAGRPAGGSLVLQHLNPEVRRIADLVQLGEAPGITLED